MGKHAIVVMGPAGSGKSTMCYALQEHYSSLRRSVHVCNFDPAAEDLRYEPSIDIRELICLEDVMEAKQLGPNGGLVYCMEYCCENVGWLQEQLNDYADDFLIVDMPGQVELLAHIPVIPAIIRLLKDEGYFVTGLFCVDAITVTSEATKFISATLLCLTTMVSVDCPIINLLTKTDLLSEEERSTKLEHFEQCDFDFLQIDDPTPQKWRELSRTIASVVNDYSLVRFSAINITDPDSVSSLVYLLDQALQYDDDAEIADKDIAADEEAGVGAEPE